MLVMEPVEQSNNSSKKVEWLAPWQFKKGQSGNPLGRYKGAKSGKERAKQFLAGMTDEEWEDFMHGLSKIDIWKMAEGMPETKTDVTSKGERILVLAPELIKKNDTDGSPE